MHVQLLVKKMTTYILSELNIPICLSAVKLLCNCLICEWFIMQMYYKLGHTNYSISARMLLSLAASTWFELNLRMCGTNFEGGARYLGGAGARGVMILPAMVLLFLHVSAEGRLLPVITACPHVLEDMADAKL